MIDTPELRRFADAEPPPRNYDPGKETLRQKLAADTERYLQCGGQIQEVDHHANRNPLYGLGTMHSLVPGRQISL